MSSVQDRLWGMIEPHVTAVGVELDDLEVLNGGRIVRVTVDSPDGVGVDQIAELSRGISRTLDAEDPIQGAYTLEVSSPGLERKLRIKRHYDKSIGRTVKVKTFAEIDGTKVHTGRLHTAGETSFVIDIDGTDREVSYADVSSARTVFVWEKPGQKTSHA
ncbi:MAG: ribosome maturation factor RimP [Acidimicrobiia bacterium]